MKVLIPTITLIILFTSLEVSIRLFSFWVEAPEKSLNFFSQSGIEKVAYTFKPNFSLRSEIMTFQTNSEGILSSVEPKTKTDCFRIMIFGASQTAGYGIKQTDNYPSQLEKMLNSFSREQCFEVVNAAQIAFPAYQMSALMKDLLPKYDPDLIIFTVNKFSMGDANLVRQDGTLASHGHKTMKHHWLTNDWGYTKRYFDLKKRLTLKDSVAKPSFFQKNFLSHSFAYKYFSPKISRLFQKTQKEEKCPSCIDLAPVEKTAAGQVLVWPRYSPMYLAPSFQNRFYQSINQAVEMSSKKEIPMILFSLDIFVDKSKLKKYEKLSVHNLLEVTGVPPPLFFKRHNLVWDFHINKKGNRLIASGLYKLLSQKRLISSTKVSEKIYDSSIYWQMYQKHLKHYKNMIFSFIDFGTLQNLHQYIGGPFIDSKESFQRLSTLLKSRPEAKLQISGFNPGSSSNKISVAVNGSQKQIEKLDLPPGFFKLDFVSDLKTKEVVDVDLNCLEEECAPIKWGRIQFVP